MWELKQFQPSSFKYYRLRGSFYNEEADKNQPIQSYFKPSAKLSSIQWFYFLTPHFYRCQRLNIFMFSNLVRSFQFQSLALSLRQYILIQVIFLGFSIEERRSLLAKGISNTFKSLIVLMRWTRSYVLTNSHLFGPTWFDLSLNYTILSPKRLERSNFMWQGIQRLNILKPLSCIMFLLLISFQLPNLNVLARFFKSYCCSYLSINYTFLTFFMRHETETAHLLSLLNVFSSTSSLSFIEIMFFKMYYEKRLLMTLMLNEKVQNQKIVSMIPQGKSKNPTLGSILFYIVINFGFSGRKAFFISYLRLSIPLFFYYFQIKSEGVFLTCFVSICLIFFESCCEFLRVTILAMSNYKFYLLALLTKICDPISCTQLLATSVPFRISLSVFQTNQRVSFPSSMYFL